MLDLMLPVLDGFEVCRRVRQASDVPIIMLTAKGQEADRIKGFEYGADDYVTKPFSPKELVARIRAVLRRSNYNDGPDKLERRKALHRPETAPRPRRGTGDRADSQGV